MDALAATAIAIFLMGASMLFAPVKPENHALNLKENLDEIAWFNLAKLPENLGFDHAEIIQDAHFFLEKNRKERLIVGELPPPKFTLQEVQYLYENILGLKPDKRNFRKRIFSNGHS